MISVMLGSGFGVDSHPDAADGGGLGTDGGGGISNSFSWMILPPRLEVFSTCSAIDMPCSCLPRP